LIAGQLRHQKNGELSTLRLAKRTQGSTGLGGFGGLGGSFREALRLLIAGQDFLGIAAQDVKNRAQASTFK
jgi:hypothetical protein